MPNDLDPSAMSIAELIRLNRATLSELRDRNITRSFNNPPGDFAETLVAAAFDGELAESSAKGFDVTTRTGRLQVKSRTNPPNATQTRGSTQFGTTRTFDTTDQFVYVILRHEDLYPVEAWTVAPADAESASNRSIWVSGSSITLSKVRQLGEDVTGQLRTAWSRVATTTRPPDRS